LVRGDRVDIYFVANNDDSFPPKAGVLAAANVIVVEMPAGEGVGGGGQSSATIRVARDQLSKGLSIEQLVANASNAKAVVIKHVAPESR
ncbi:MAG TPA: hypothetical protein VE287_03635, partial [Actinopolymorphaceae bacterium]|nr:hypothetical protein [Actinopolymorphaceae bacterium]